MSHRIITLLLLLMGGLVLSAQRTVVCVDSDERTPIEYVVITDKTTGHLLAITDAQGIATLSNDLQEVGLSHLAYRSDVYPVGDTLRLVRAERRFAEAIVSSQPADYYRLRAVVRTYQYIDSVPVNFVDALLDFYVNGKGTSLEYDALRLDVYQNVQYIRVANLNKGASTASDNSIIHWILNPHIATKGRDLWIDDAQIIRHRKLATEAGRFAQDVEGQYWAKVNLLQPKDTAVSTMFGRSVQFLEKTLEQSFPPSVDLNHLRSYDMSSYRFIVRRNTWTKKYPAVVHLTKIEEITVIERERITKEQYKQVKLDTDWTHLSRSKKAVEGLPPSMLPLLLQAHIGKTLVLIPPK